MPRKRLRWDKLIGGTADGSFIPSDQPSILKIPSGELYELILIAFPGSDMAIEGYVLKTSEPPAARSVELWERLLREALCHQYCSDDFNMKGGIRVKIRTPDKHNKHIKTIIIEDGDDITFQPHERATSEPAANIQANNLTIQLADCEIPHPTHCTIQIRTDPDVLHNTLRTGEERPHTARDVVEHSYQRSRRDEQHLQALHTIDHRARRLLIQLAEDHNDPRLITYWSSWSHDRVNDLAGAIVTLDNITGKTDDTTFTDMLTPVDPAATLRAGYAQNDQARDAAIEHITKSEAESRAERAGQLDNERCERCGQYYPTPVGHHHSEEECLANQERDQDLDAPDLRRRERAQDLPASIEEAQQRLRDRADQAAGHSSQLDSQALIDSVEKTLEHFHTTMRTLIDDLTNKYL